MKTFTINNLKNFDKVLCFDGTGQKKPIIGTIQNNQINFPDATFIALKENMDVVITRTKSKIVRWQMTFN